MAIIAIQRIGTGIMTTLFLTASAINALLPHDLSPWGMFVNADIVVKIVMIGLAFASFITWTICVAKMLELRSETGAARKRPRGARRQHSAERCGARDRERHGRRCFLGAVRRA